MKKIVVLMITIVAALPVSAAEISMGGSFDGGAFLTIDGKHRVLRVGQTSPEGVTLISAEAKSAVIEIEGVRETVSVSRSVTTSFKPAERAIVRIPSGAGGHYITPGRINGKPVNLLVDTGATTVAINQSTARSLGIDFRAGEQISVATASGVTTAYLVTLDSVSVGTVTVHNVEAAVSTSDFPTEILLGNSYLRRVELRREAGVLVLESRF